MQLAGVPVDADLWRARADDAVYVKHTALQRLIEVSGRQDLFGGAGLNWDSKQIIDVLNDLTIRLRVIRPCPGALLLRSTTVTRRHEQDTAIGQRPTTDLPN